jgi:(2R)-3-sulfolactate dehydrogenase (NADP+)
VSTDKVRITVAAAAALAGRALQQAGLAERHARLVAAQFAAADADGITSHGLARVPSACAMLAAGKIKPDAVTSHAQKRPGVLSVDADDGFPHLAIDEAAPALAAAARAQGIASLSVANAYACGVLGYHTERLARPGLVVLGFTQAPASIAPVGGVRAVIGTNPMSLAIPREDGASLLIDQSSSVVAKSEVLDRQARGEAIPPHWALDSGGQPTTSAEAALQGGTMAPFGGYKGFGAGLIVEVFAALLTGANLGLEAPGLADKASGPPRVGAYFIAIDPAPAGFGARLQILLQAIAAQPEARIPGQRRLEWRARTAREGLAIPAALHTQLLAIAGLS